MDVRAGQVATRGWVELSGTEPVELAKRLHGWGVRRALVTDAGRDGTMSCPNLELLQSVTETGLQVIAAGGISSLADIVTLARLIWTRARWSDAPLQWCRGFGKKDSLVQLGDEIVGERIIPCLMPGTGGGEKSSSWTARCRGPGELARRYDASGLMRLVFPTYQPVWRVAARCWMWWRTAAQVLSP